MYKFKMVFAVNGMRTETIVSATTFDDAKRLVQAQYPGSNVQFYSWTRI